MRTVGYNELNLKFYNYDIYITLLTEKHVTLSKLNLTIIFYTIYACFSTVLLTYVYVLA